MELYKRFTLKAEAGTISEEGIRQINVLIGKQKLGEEIWQNANPGMTRHYLPALPDTWQWVWQTAQGDYRGTFPKRVAQFYHKVHAVKLPWSVVSELGNIARSHSADDVVFEFEFVNRIRWSAGEFGDDDSCYWGCNAGAREMLEDNGALAVRFYSPESGRGIGRAWLVEIEDGLRIVFNGYGFTGNPTLVIARVVADFFKVSYRKITLTNEGGSSGVLWIDHAGQAYLIGPADQIADFDDYDLGWTELHSETCHECGNGIGEYDVFYGPDDLGYCEDCAAELFDSCEECSETYWRSDMQYVDDRYLCNWCAAEAEPPEREGKRR